MFPISFSQVIRISVLCSVLACTTFVWAQQSEQPVTEEDAPRVKAPPPPTPDRAATESGQENASSAAQPRAAVSEAAPAVPAPSNAARGTTMTVVAPASGTALALLVDTAHTDRQGRELLTSMVWRFVRKMPEGVQACVFTTSDKPALQQDFTEKRDELLRAVRRIRTGGQPALLAGVQQAANHLRGSASERLAIVLFTTARHVKEPNLEDAIAALHGGKNVEFDAVAGPASDWQLQEQLQRLAVKTNGFALFPAKAGDLGKVAEVAAHKSAGDEDVANAGGRGPGESVHPVYTAVVVRHIAVADNPETQEFQSGDDELMQKMLIAQLQHEKVFPYVLDGRTEGAKVNASASSGRTLEVQTSIVQYRRGNRVQRRLMGAMGGAMVKVNVVLRDLASGRPVQAFMEKGSASSGLFGGSNEEVQSKALKDVVNNIVDDMKKYGRKE